MAQARTIRIALAITALTAGITACAGKKGLGDGSKKAREQTKETDSVDSHQELNVRGLTVKNYMQLKASAESCLGPNLGVITDGMFNPGLCPNAQKLALADGQAPILGGDKCGLRGQNVMDALRDQLWSPDIAGRTDTLANQLNPSYLQALAVAADVYAHGVPNPMSLCQTPDKARALLERCLPQYAPEDLDASASVIQGLCAQDQRKARQAIATILGSVAFASAEAKGEDKE